MNPLDFAARVLRDVYGDRLSDPDAAAVSEPEPAPEVGGVSREDLHRVGLEPIHVTAFEMSFRARAADEALVLERLAVETARVDSSWVAALTLFAPDTPCAGLYATQSPESHLSRVVVPPEAHKPTQPLTTPNP